MEKLTGLRIPPYLFKEGMLVFTSLAALTGKPAEKSNLSKLKNPAFCRIVEFEHYEEPPRDRLVDARIIPPPEAELEEVLEYLERGSNALPILEDELIIDPTKVYAAVELGDRSLRRTPISSLRWLQDVGGRWSKEEQKTLYDWPKLPDPFVSEVLAERPYRLADKVVLHSGKFKRLTGHTQRHCIGFIAKQEEEGVFWVTTTVVRLPDPYREPALVCVGLDEVRLATSPAPEPWGEDE